MGASSKIHINGRFSEDIFITYNIRQGCPISSFLFAIAMQPFLAFPNYWIEKCLLLGTSICNSLTISCHFFGDNLGQFIPLTTSGYSGVVEAINTYTRALGSELNIAKSVIIPFTSQPLPEWVSNFGYKILQPKDVHRYLGGPFGNDISLVQLDNFAIDKVRKCINSWSEKTLSLSRRVLLIRQILLAIPIYNLMCLPMLKKTSKLVACMLKGFLWGFNPSGGKKDSSCFLELKICAPKEFGGLRIKHIHSHSLDLLGQLLKLSINLLWSGLSSSFPTLNVLWKNGIIQ